MSETMHEMHGEFTPLHEGPDQFISRRFLRRAFKFIAPLAARAVLGAIPGIGPVAAMVGGQLVSRLTREQQEHMETALHELASGEMGMHEFGAHEYGAHEFGAHEFGAHEMGGMHEFGHGETVLGEHSGEMTHEFGGQHELGHEGEFSHEAGETESGEAAHWEMHPESEFGAGHSEAAHNEAALMELIAHEAATAHNAAAAEALAGSLVPLAMRMARAGGPALYRTTPALAMAAGRLNNAFRRSGATRQLSRVLPSILTRTVRALGQAAAQGRPVTPQQAVRMMATQTYRTLNTPEVTINILIRSGRRRRVRRVAY